MTAGESTEHTAVSNRWLDERPVTSASLPSDVAGNMSRFLDASIKTLDEFVVAVRDATDGGGIVVNELCHVADETPHRAMVENETYHFRCFYDGIALAYLVDESVDIRTESPANEPIEIRATPEGDIDVTPSDAAMSFGIVTNQEALADNDPTVEDVYEGVCPYVKAFPSRESYERWAERVDAATVGLPLVAGMPIAVDLAK